MQDRFAQIDQGIREHAAGYGDVIDAAPERQTEHESEDRMNNGIELHLTKAAEAASAVFGLALLAKHLDGLAGCVEDDVLGLSGWKPYTRGEMWKALEVLATVAHSAIVDAGRAVGWDAESGEPLESPLAPKQVPWNATEAV